MLVGLTDWSWQQLTEIILYAKSQGITSMFLTDHDTLEICDNDCPYRICRIIQTTRQQQNCYRIQSIYYDVLLDLRDSPYSVKTILDSMSESHSVDGTNVVPISWKQTELTGQAEIDLSDYYYQEYKKFNACYSSRPLDLAIDSCIVLYRDCRTHETTMTFRNFLYVTWKIINDNIWSKEVDVCVRKFPQKWHQRILVVDFDRDYFLELYPYLKKSLNLAKEALEHYIRNGIREGLIPNRTMWNWISRLRGLVLHRHIDSLTYVNVSNSTKIYIITRTHRRRDKFAECRQSVLDQEISCQIVHMVGYDDSETEKYVTHCPDIVPINCKNLNVHPNRYIDRFYEKITDDADSWIVVLDDDDVLTSRYSLSTAISRATQDIDVITWMTYRPDRLIYPQRTDRPVIGEIATCSYMYRSKLRKCGIWESGDIGDFAFYKYLIASTIPDRRVYIPKLLAGINYLDKTSGWACKDINIK